MERGTFSFLSAALVASVQAAFSSAALAGSNDALVKKHAAANGVPEHLVHRVIRIESRGNAAAVHRGNYGLMQIRLSTARGVGYSGDAKGLLDPNTNLTYAVKYLAGAYRAANGDHNRAVSYYAGGYYYAAKRQQRHGRHETAVAFDSFGNNSFGSNPADAHAQQQDAMVPSLQIWPQTRVKHRRAR